MLPKLIWKEIKIDKSNNTTSAKALNFVFLLVKLPKTEIPNNQTVTPKAALQIKKPKRTIPSNVKRVCDCTNVTALLN